MQVSIWQHFEPTLAILMVSIGQFFTDFKGKILKIILPSGHTEFVLPLSLHHLLGKSETQHATLSEKEIFNGSLFNLNFLPNRSFQKLSTYLV